MCTAKVQEADARSVVQHVRVDQPLRQSVAAAPRSPLGEPVFDL
jgi:hypothetical protein